MTPKASTYPITGIPCEIPLRVEVDDFYKKPEYAMQLNLFLLAMAKFQKMDPEEKLSYFQVAGIHDLPYQTWDDPENPDPVKHDSYCAHNLVTFPTWHRPYMLLFEQRVYETMLEVILTFPTDQQNTLKAEARKWRLPYWDWATKKTRSDQAGETKQVYAAALILEDPTVIVFDSIDPTQGRHIANPMYQFTAPGPMGKWGIIPVASDDGNIEFQKCTTTSKIPPGPNVDGGTITEDGTVHAYASWVDGTQNVPAITENFQKHAWYQKGKENPCIGEAVSRLFSGGYITRYRQFAASRYQPTDNPREALSLEGIHNNLHNWIGGNWGHMGQNEVAAFDPIFYMHHANIDRLLAIYQALNAEDDRMSWWVKDRISTSSGKDFIAYTPKTLLSPFHSDNEGTTYNSEDVRHVAKLGYTYPELQRWNFTADGDGDKKYIADIHARIAALYPFSGSMVICPEDYIVNVIYERYALGGAPFTVEIFLRPEHKSDVDTSVVPDWLVGSVYNFSSKQEGCGNCAQQARAGILTSGQVTLTGALLASFEGTDVEWGAWSKVEAAAYLKKHLRRRVLNAAGAEVKMPSLKVSVAVGRRKISKIEHDKGVIVLKPVSGGMRSLPTFLSSVEKSTSISGSKEPTFLSGVEELPSLSAWKPVEGKVEYGHTVTDKEGGVYDVITITPPGLSPRSVALTGYSDYEDILSI